MLTEGSVSFQLIQLLTLNCFKVLEFLGSQNTMSSLQIGEATLQQPSSLPCPDQETGWNPTNFSTQSVCVWESHLQLHELQLVIVRAFSRCLFSSQDILSVNGKPVWAWTTQARQEMARLGKGIFQVYRQSLKVLFQKILETFENKVLPIVI